ncbi:MAG: hypothetical protein ABL962_13315 [Fimbriimonadaceae bacterium]
MASRDQKKPPAALHQQGSFITEAAGTAFLGDKWIAASGMQKALRRGDVTVAHDAANALRLLDNDMLRRRVQTTLVEDVAPLDVEGLSAILTARLIVGQIDAALEVLARSPKERTPDYLVAMLQFSPRLTPARHELGKADDQTLLNVVCSPHLDLATRALAAWYAGGTVQLPGSNLLRRYGNSRALFAAYRDAGLPAALIDGCQKVLGTQRNALPLIYPLVFQAMNQDSTVRVEARHIPPPRTCNGIPLYALGGHTRLGKAAIRAWVEGNDHLQRSARALVDPARSFAAAELAVFFVESSAISPAVSWSLGKEMEREGIEADFYSLDPRIEALSDFLATAKEQLPQLDDIRAALVEQRVRVMKHESGAHA